MEHNQLCSHAWLLYVYGDSVLMVQLLAHTCLCEYVSGALELRHLEDGYIGVGLSVFVFEILDNPIITALVAQYRGKNVELNREYLYRARSILQS